MQGFPKSEVLLDSQLAPDKGVSRMLAERNEGVEIVRVALPAAVHVVAFLVDMSVSWFLEVASPTTGDRVRIKLAASDGKALVSAATRARS